MLGVPTSTLAVWRSTGRVQLPYIKVGGHVRYKPEDIEAFLRDRWAMAGSKCAECQTTLSLADAVQAPRGFCCPNCGQALLKQA